MSPSTVDENPHCGDRQSWRLVDPPLDLAPVLQRACLGGDQAEHHHLARAHDKS